MIPTLTILWPRIAAPPIEETRFSYRFCRRMSEQLCKEVDLGLSWLDYNGDPALKEILPRIDGDRVFVVNPKSCCHRRL